MTKKRKRPTGQTIGSILVGFDQEVFRTLPPAHELVAKSQPVRGVSGDGDGIEVVFPDDEPGRPEPKPDQPAEAAEPGE